MRLGERLHAVETAAAAAGDKALASCREGAAAVKGHQQPATAPPDRSAKSPNDATGEAAQAAVSCASEDDGTSETSRDDDGGGSNAPSRPVGGRSRRGGAVRAALTRGGHVRGVLRSAHSQRLSVSR